MVNLSLFEHLGPFWAHLDPFGPFQTRIDILLRSTSAKPYFVHLGQKNHFCLKWSKRVQMDPNGVPNDQKDLGWPFWSLLGPFGPLWSVDKPAMFGKFWSKMDHFGPSPVMNGGPQGKKGSSPRLLMEPQNTLFGTWIWPQSKKNDKNRPKFHDKWPFFCHYLAMIGKLWAQKKFSCHI